MRIYKANILFTPSPEQFQVVEYGYIAVDADGIIEGVYATLPTRLQGEPLTDFGDSLLIPAMNDMHVHAPQYRNMGLAMDMELLPWLNTYTFPEEAKYSNTEYAERMYSRFVHDLWLHGTIRASVFATIHPAATQILAQLFTEAGLGALIGLVGMNRNCPDTLLNRTEEALRDTEDLCDSLQENKQVKAIVTPRFVPACTADMLQAFGELAQRCHLPVQSHLSENRSEIAWVRELEPESTCYGDAYNRYGLFGQTPTLMAHCCYTEGEELELMQRNHVMVVHCPTSNCNLGS
ncbi:MAG TPA: guanine deaminase, partial [Bacteroidales bacterium]|nr:guanine deaminase [Bacteroidales bacterium]